MPMPKHRMSFIDLVAANKLCQAINRNEISFKDEDVFIQSDQSSYSPKTQSVNKQHFHQAQDATEVQAQNQTENQKELQTEKQVNEQQVTLSEK